MNEKQTKKNTLLCCEVPTTITFSCSLLVVRGTNTFTELCFEYCSCLLLYIMVPRAYRATKPLGSISP